MSAGGDPGLQPERTVLAWRRTTLSLAVGAALIIRLTVHDLGWWSALVGALGGALSAAVWVVSTRRFERASRAVHGGVESSTLGGLSVTATGASCVLICVVAALWVTSHL